MFSSFWRKEKPHVVIQSSLSALEQLVIVKSRARWLKNIEQLCPFVSPGLLNESWNWFFSRWHLHQRVRPPLFSVAASFPHHRGKTLYWMQVNSVLSSCLGDAAPSDWLSKWGIDVLCSYSPDRLWSAFYLSFFHRIITVIDLKACSAIHSANSGRDGHRRNMRALCAYVCVCVFNKPLKWHKLTEVNYVFLNMVAICVLMNAAVQVN